MLLRANTIYITETLTLDISISCTLSMLQPFKFRTPGQLYLYFLGVSSSKATNCRGKIKISIEDLQISKSGYDYNVILFSKLILLLLTPQQRSILLMNSLTQPQREATCNVLYASTIFLSNSHTVQHPALLFWYYSI